LFINIYLFEYIWDYSARFGFILILYTCGRQMSDDDGDDDDDDVND